MASGSGRQKAANANMKGGSDLDRVPSHALNSDLEDLTPVGSGNSTPLSGYSPHSQPFAERPENRTQAGVAARQTLSSLPSPPPFTPAVGQSSGTPQMSAAGSNNMRQAWSPAAAGDTPGVTSAWQPGAGGSPEASSATFAFTPVVKGEAASPDAQLFGHAEQAAAAQHQGSAAAPKAADFVRAATTKLSASHDSDAVSDASGSIASTNTSARSSSMPAGSPGDILRAATSKLSAQHAISGSSRIQNSSRRKSGALKTPMQQKIVHAPTPHSTPMLESPEMRRSDDLAAQVDDTADSSAAAAAVLAAAAAGSPGSAKGVVLDPSGSLKVHVVGTPPAASPSKSTKSPGSRSSVVSIGSVCGAAAAGAALTPQQIIGRASDELEAGKYTPIMKLDFGSTPGPTPAASVVAAGTPNSLSDRPAAGTGSGSISPLRSYDLGDLGTPTGTTPAPPEGDRLTDLVNALTHTGSKQMLREEYDDARRQDQLQAAMQAAGADAAAALGIPDISPENDMSMPWNQMVARETARGQGWWARYGHVLLLVLAGVGIIVTSLVAVQMLPPSTLPPGMACTPQNAAACRAALEAQLRAADKQPTWLQLKALSLKWHLEDQWALWVTGKLPDGVQDFDKQWLKHVSPKRLAAMSHDQAIAFFSDVPKEQLSPEISARLAAAMAHKELTEKQEAAARKAAEEARLAAERAEQERIAREKAEAGRRAAEEARLARERAEAERIARERAEAERRAAEKARIAREKAEAERLVRERAEAERKAKAERIAREKAEAERIAREKAEAARIAKERAEAERLERERAEAERKAAERAEAERIAAERAAEQARLAAEAAEAKRLAAERAAEAEREAAERAAHEQSEREAAAAEARAAGIVTEEAVPAESVSPAGRSWLPDAAVFVLLLSLGGGGGYVWFAQQAAKAASQQHLDEIRTNFDEREGQAYQDLGDMDPDMQQQEEAAAGAAASAAVAAVGAAAADALAAGVAMAKVLTPSFKAPRPRRGRAAQAEAEGILSDNDGDNGPGGDDGAGGAVATASRGAGSSRAAAAAAAAAGGGATTPRSNRRGSRAAAAAADAGAESDAAASTGKARSVRGRKAAATPGRALEPLLEDAPAEPQEATAGEVAAEPEPAPAAGARGSRRQSAPAAGAPAASAGTARRRASAAAAAEPPTEAAATPARRSTRAARTPRV